MQTNFYFLAVCSCLLAITQARPSGHDSSHPLVGVPDLSDFAGLHYPKLDVIDLGETQKYVPEKEIKVIRTIKISQPYPVEVPVKVPYPVPVVKEVPIEVTKVVKVPDHSHVDVVKSVQVHSSASTEQIHGSGAGQWESSVGGHPDASQYAEEQGGQPQAGNYEYQPNYYQGDGYESSEGHH